MKRQNVMTCRRFVRRAAVAALTVALLPSLVEYRVARAGPPELPAGPQALKLFHFPDRMHAFIWRNWRAVEPERIAAVLGTSVENVTSVAESMGLPPAVPIPPEQKTRGYFWMTMCRRNWHVLPGDQLATLLGTTPRELADFLRVEEHANWIILGGFVPRCEPLRWRPPDAETRRRAARIKEIVRECFGDEIHAACQPRFDFIRRLSEPLPSGTAGEPPGRSPLSPRYICSYLKVFGDPLSDPKIDMYPEGLLQRLSALGVDGVWLYGVLRQLAPGGDEFPEFGAGYETRQANLRTLVQRAKRHGIGVYLYINEPRAQPESFFAKRPGMAGTRGAHGACMCTSHPAVRKWMSGALAHLFSHVPNLGGVFTITASENPSNCAWLGDGSRRLCPRCKNRTGAEIIAEVNAAIEEGVHRGNPTAKVIVWDWGWSGGNDPDKIIPLLPKSVYLMCMSERGSTITRGGIASVVEEYSLSAVGPSPRALHCWKLAKQHGLKTAAKVQINTTWELSSLPYLPVMDLVAEHCHNLAKAGIDGMMLSWTLGGYPSPNLEVARCFSQSPVPSIDEALDGVARKRFGPDGAPHARKAWTRFSNAFREYPFSIPVLYYGPMQLGPANLLYPTPTGYNATMVGFPYDDIQRWRGSYPLEVLAGQFEKIAAGWQEGLAELRIAVQNTPAASRIDAETELVFARAARLYFKSAANQVRFVLARNALLNTKNSLSPNQRRKCAAEIRVLVEDEIALAREMFTLSRINSCIGFEAASQYFFLPLDLVEKVVCCRLILEDMKKQPFTGVAREDFPRGRQPRF